MPISPSSISHSFSAPQQEREESPRLENLPMTTPTKALGTPPKLATETLRIVALGGISEVGRNMTMFETRQPGTKRPRLLVVDCGMLLGHTNAPGVDLGLP